MKKKIILAGAGMGSPEGMTSELLREAAQAELIIGSERIVSSLRSPEKRVLAEYRPDEIRRLVDEAPEERVLILVTGDQGFFSAADRIRNCLSDYEPSVIPGISSVSYFSARTGIPYDNAALVSAHGRELNLVSVVRRNRVSFILTGGNLPELLRRLCDYGYSGLKVAVGENLSAENERIRQDTAENLLKQSADDPFSVLSLMMVQNPGAVKSVPSGISDGEFVRGKVPMTKREVRALVLSSLRIGADSIVVDIGSGTGSVAVEAALSAYRGTVYAVEKKEEALKLIRKNAVKFRTDNIRIVKGEAPEALTSLPAADAYFIGGSGGRLREILEEIHRGVRQDRKPWEAGEEEPSRCRLVISAATIQTLSDAHSLLKELHVVNTSVTQIQASRSEKAGRYDFMKAENPVFVITGEF